MTGFIRRREIVLSMTCSRGTGHAIHSSLEAVAGKLDASMPSYQFHCIVERLHRDAERLMTARPEASSSTREILFVAHRFGHPRDQRNRSADDRRSKSSRVLSPGNINPSTPVDSNAFERSHRRRSISMPHLSARAPRDRNHRAHRCPDLSDRLVQRRSCGASDGRTTWQQRVLDHHHTGAGTVNSCTVRMTFSALP